MFIKRIGFLFVVILSITGCSFFSKNNEGNAVARVGENYLYEDDLPSLKLSDQSRDSSEVVQAFVDSWIKEQLLLKKALQNLSEQQIDFEKQLENYKNSLLIFEYENQLVKQKLDTLVTASEIQLYYNENQNNFDLKSTVLEARFIKIINSAPLKDSMKFWLFSRNDEFDVQLAEYCTQFANNCQIDTGVWIPFQDLVRIFPETIDPEEISINKNQNILEDSTGTLVIDVTQIKRSGESAPISLVSDQIKSIIINRRKIQLLSKVRSEIYEDATLKKEYEVYN